MNNENPNNQVVSEASEPRAEKAPDSIALAAALEGLLFVHNRPISFDHLSELLGIEKPQIEALVFERKKVFDEDPARGLQIIINEEGVQLATKASISSIIQRLEGQKLVSLSLPALETLSVIAYKQPITKAEVEAIRGVNCDGVISTLLEKKLIYVSGEKQVLGRPRLYSTTQDFLYYFGMKSLKELPNPSPDLPEADPEKMKTQGELSVQASQDTLGEQTENSAASSISGSGHES